MVEERPMPGLGGNYQPMFFAGVKTEDLPIHLTWVSRKTDATPPKYPPAVTDDLYWMVANRLGCAPRQLRRKSSWR